MNLAQHILVAAVRVYQCVRVPLFGLFGGAAQCRFNPSCSQYAIDAVKARGAIRGSFLALRRLSRCHPWGGCGEDPAPVIPHAHASAAKG